MHKAVYDTIDRPGTRVTVIRSRDGGRRSSITRGPRGGVGLPALFGAAGFAGILRRVASLVELRRKARSASWSAGSTTSGLLSLSPLGETWMTMGGMMHLHLGDGRRSSQDDWEETVRHLR
jgi:hypothetical protein